MKGKHGIIINISMNGSIGRQMNLYMKTVIIEEVEKVTKKKMFELKEEWEELVKWWRLYKG